MKIKCIKERPGVTLDSDGNIVLVYDFTKGKYYDITITRKDSLYNGYVELVDNIGAIHRHSLFDWKYKDHIYDVFDIKNFCQREERKHKLKRI
jgi:hypothetical protein